MVDKEKSNRLRVLFVNRMACLERGGGETFDLEISRHLGLTGVDVSFLSGAPLFGPSPMPIEGATVLHTPWLRRFPWDKIRGGWRIRQLEFEWFERKAARWITQHAGEFDVIQICELPNLVYWLKKSGVKIPVVMRLTAPNYYDPRGGVPLADALIASGTSIELLKERGHTEVINIPNAVDAERFRPQPSDFRSRHAILEEEFVVLYVARFQAFKNHACLLEAFAQFVKGFPRSRLVLAGSGPLQEQTVRQAAALGITKQVLFLGETPYAELPVVYAGADLKVISSDYESFCFAAIEAMSTALPILSTDCGWVPRLIEGGAGTVVPVGNVAALTEGLRYFSDHPAAGRRMGAAGRQQVLDRHTWPSSAEKLLELYRALFSDHFV